MFRRAKPGAAPRPRSRGSRLRFALDPFLLLVALVSLFPIAPLMQPGYQWDAHDARHSVYFLFELDRCLQDGVLYPRWLPDFTFGYGYPMFNIYGPFSSYMGEAFHLLGFGYADAVKIVFALSVVLSGLAMYGFVRRAIGRRAGLVASVAYMVIPYRLVDLYVRAALAEAVAYVFVPLVLWGVWSAVRRPRRANVVGLAFAYAALAFTHPLSAMLLTVIVAFLGATLAIARLNRDQPFRGLSRGSWPALLGHAAHVLLPVVAGLVLGLGLCAFFLLPAMTENRFVRLDQWYGGRYAWGGDFVAFFQLFSPRWGFGYSGPGPDDGMSFQLGAVPLVLALFGGVAALHRHRDRRGDGDPAPLPERGEQNRAAIAPQPATDGIAVLSLFFVLLSLVVVFLMLRVSAPVWQALPLVRLVQFPWRLLAVATVSMAFLCGAVLERERPDHKGYGMATILLVLLLVLGSLPYMRAETSEREVSLAELMRFQQSADEMTGSTLWVQEIPRWSSMADYAVAGLPVTSKINYGLLYAQPQVQGRTIELRADRELIEYYAPQTALVTFDRFYYPGWRAYLLDAATSQVVAELPITQRGPLGLITVEVPPGVGRVLLRFRDSPVRTAGWLVTGLSLAVVGLIVPARLALRRRRGPLPAVRRPRAEGE